MSLPPTTKDISTHPAKGSVVEPVDKAKREKDVEQKLKFYTVIQALRASRLPTNSQIDSFLAYFKKNVSTVQTQSNKDKSGKELSEDTKTLFSDITEILDALRNEVRSKNSDEILQQLIWESRNADDETPAVKLNKDDVNVPVTMDKAKEDARTALRNIRTLATLLATNSEARKLLSDFSIIGRDLVARAAMKIAPSDEELKNVDETVKGDKFVSKDESPISPTSGQQGSSEEPTSGQNLSSEPQPIEIPTEGQIPAPYSATTQGSPPSGVLSAREPGEIVSDEDDDEVKDEKKGFMQKLKSKLPEHTNKTKTFLTEEVFPQERRDQWIWRCKKVIIECQDHPEYQESITWLLDYISTYVGHARESVNGVNVEKSESLDSTIEQVKSLLDRFAAGKSSHILIIDKINLILDDAKSDEELSAWINDVGDWIRECLLAPGYILEPTSTNKGRELMARGRGFHGLRVGSTTNEDGDKSGMKIESIEGEGKYKPHFEALFDGIGEWINGWTEDSENKKLAHATSKFTKNLLFTGESGSSKLTFKREMWSDLREVVLPVIVERVGYIPIPRIEYSDDGLDLVVENLTLSGKNMFPNIVGVESHNYMKFSPYGGIENEDNHEFIVTLSQIQTDMRDVAFYFKKKTGVPKLKDSGLADVVISGDGISATIHVKSTPDPESFFEVKNVHVKVANMKFSIRDSKHDLLYKTIKPLATGLIKKQIAKAIKDGIETVLGLLDGQLVNARDRMREENEDGKKAGLAGLLKRTKTDDDTSSSIRRSTTSTVSHSQFKVVSSKRASILATEGNPRGWVNQVRDKEAFEDGHGQKGGDGGSGKEGWKCDAFDVGKM